MATRKIKEAKDLATGELIYLKGHALATFMSDGNSVEEAICTIQNDINDFPEAEVQGDTLIILKVGDFSGGIKVDEINKDLLSLATNVGYIKTDGTIYAGDTNWVYTNYIKCLPGSSLKLVIEAHADISSVTFYNDDYSIYLTNVLTTNTSGNKVETTITIPKEAVYMRVCGASSTYTHVKYQQSWELIINDLTLIETNKNLLSEVTELGNKIKEGLDLIDNVLNTKSDKVGYEPDLKVRFAEELVGRGESKERVIGDLTPTGEISIGDGNATIERIKGNSVVWNQLSKNGGADEETNGLTFTNLGNGTWKINGTAETSYNYQVATAVTTLTPSHKYLLHGCPSGGSGSTYYLYDRYYNRYRDTGTGYFFTAADTQLHFKAAIYINAGVTITNLVFEPRLHDLTQMFGAGNEPTTIEEFESRKPIGVTNEYNEGEIISYQQWGEKVVWNQWIKPTWNTTNATITKDDESVIVTIKSTSITYYGIYFSINAIPVNHKILLDIDTTITANAHIYGIVGDLWKSQSIITVAKDRPYLRIYKEGTFAEGDSFILRKCNIYDLTLMFGEGNEPTTVEEFERRRPRNVTDEYNEGTEINGDIEIKSVGLNQWDEEWENGYWDATNGKPVYIDTHRRTKNPIKVIPNTSYQVYGCKDFVILYDKDMNYVGYRNLYNSTTFTTPSNCAYIYINLPTNYPNTKVCLHLTHSNIPNEYKPYTSTTTPLPNVSLIKDENGNQLFPYGLCSAGNAYDEITETKAIKRVGVVDMGTLEWTYRNTAIDFLSSVFTPAPKYIGDTLCISLTNDKSITSGTQVNKSVRIANTLKAIVVETSYTDATSFKQAMQGVLLYYELAEPIEVDLDKPFNLSYDAWDFGTEQLITEFPTTLLHADISYLFNAVDRIRENTINISLKLDPLTLTVKDNGNIVIGNILGLTKEFMPATPSGDPMHYAYEVAGALYNNSDTFIVKDADWKSLVDPVDYKAQWDIDVISDDLVQPDSITYNGTSYRYAKDTRIAQIDNSTQPRYRIVLQDTTTGKWIWDDTKVLHLPKHWYLNGIGDLTNKEINLSYFVGPLKPTQNNLGQIAVLKIRTTFLTLDSGGAPPYNMYYIAHSTPLEIFRPSKATLSYIFQYDGALAWSSNLRYLIGCRGSHIPSTNSVTTLSIVLVYNIKNSSNDLRFSPNISKASILYLINNCIPTTAITIKLHTTAYNRLINDADIITALETKNTLLQESGGSIGLVSE